MKSFFRKVAIAALSTAVLAGGIIPAQAMPMAVAPVTKLTVQTDVTQVRHHHHHRRGYYRGYRGSRHHRPHHRFHDGYWFPLAAFGAGALIGGAIAAPPRHSAPIVRGAPGINPQHFEWCHARYRSYDSYSNTFQPYHGPRKTCYSPYF